VVKLLVLLSLTALILLMPKLVSFKSTTNQLSLPSENHLAQQQPAPQEWSPDQGIADLDEGPRGAIPNPTAPPFQIVGRRFTPEEFVRYVRDEVAGELDKKDKTTGKAHWRPEFLVLHNTWKPTIGMRPSGFGESDMRGLASYYAHQGWHAGPHLFVDQNGIWVFTPLTVPGVHSPSWNRKSWGIEQLGDFETEPYDSGKGAQVRANAVAALAILSIAAEKDIGTLKLHKEDTQTTHKTCPGIKCDKDKMIAAVRAEKDKWEQAWKEK
jgi:N-acetylmuramoyl-L-alanine amidase